MVWMIHDWWSPTITCSRCLSFWKLSAVYSLNILYIRTHGNCLFIFVFFFSLKWNHDANQHRKWAMQERNKAHCIPQLLRASVRCCPCFFFLFLVIERMEKGMEDERSGTLRDIITYASSQQRRGQTSLHESNSWSLWAGIFRLDCTEGPSHREREKKKMCIITTDIASIIHTELVLCEETSALLFLKKEKIVGASASRSRWLGFFSFLFLPFLSVGNGGRNWRRKEGEWNACAASCGDQQQEVRQRFIWSPTSRARSCGYLKDTVSRLFSAFLSYSTVIIFNYHDNKLPQDVGSKDNNVSNLDFF